MDSPRVGELWRVFKSHYLAELELSAVLRAGTLGIVITDGFCQGGGRLVEVVDAADSHFATCPSVVQHRRRRT